ncbi:hypothetical protein ACHLNJ_05270 [Staphylococcus aureus]
MIRFNEFGEVTIVNDNFKRYIDEITTIYNLDKNILTVDFLKNNKMRNNG